MNLAAAEYFCVAKLPFFSIYLERFSQICWSTILPLFQRMKTTISRFHSLIWWHVSIVRYCRSCEGAWVCATGSQTEYQWGKLRWPVRTELALALSPSDSVGTDPTWSWMWMRVRAFVLK